MAGQERAGAYQRPPHLREEVDLPDLAAELLRTNLQIPNGTAWKINYRERTPGGGVKLIISWTEEIDRRQPFVFVRQLRKARLELLSHLMEGLGEHADLIAAIGQHMFIEIARGDAPRRRGQLA